MFMQLFCSALASFSLMSAKPNIRGDTQAPNSLIEVPSDWQEYNFNNFYINNGSLNSLVKAENGVLKINGYNSKLDYNTIKGVFDNRYLAFKLEGSFSLNSSANAIQLYCITESGLRSNYVNINTNDWYYTSFDSSFIDKYNLVFVLFNDVSFENCSLKIMLSDKPLEGKDFIPNLQYLVEDTYNKGYQEGYNKGYQEGLNEWSQGGILSTASIEYGVIDSLGNWLSPVYRDNFKNIGGGYGSTTTQENSLEAYADKGKPTFIASFSVPISSDKFSLWSVYGGSNFGTSVVFKFSDNSLFELNNANGDILSNFKIPSNKLISSIVVKGSNADTLQLGLQSSSLGVNDYNVGYNKGYQEGYNKGFEIGSIEAYNNGYNKGYQEGSTTADFNPFFWLASLGTMLMGIFSIELFPGFSVGGLILIPLILAIVAVVIGFFGKGGK